jgi:hypothetical protein
MDNVPMIIVAHGTKPGRDFWPAPANSLLVAVDSRHNQACTPKDENALPTVRH